ncbi:MAG: penicillin acylase family protein [Bryobacteraceae bacterium]|nr:penicillin acylase family protein [Bryobacteraceae bacterium]
MILRLAIGLSLLSAAGAAADRGVEILWDRYGVAHVYAQDVRGMFYGYGYAQMQSHANLVLKLYGESRGRGAEYFGPKALELDRWVLTNGVPERGQAWYTQQTPEFRGYLDAFAAGMNEYARRHPEQIAADRKAVLPITGADPLIHVHRIVHFSYLSSQARVFSAGTGRPPAFSAIGSNAWAIAPAHSASGKTMVLMNPHLPWQDWYTYYETHLNGPGLNLYGASQIGFPVLRFVFSDYLAFTQTVNSIDGSDLYRITPAENGYRFDDAIKPFTTETKTIKVKGEPDQTLVVKHTVHGPVVWENDRVVLAQRTAGLDKPFLLEQYWKMAIARNFAEYEAQLKRLEVPTFNITYGDRDGHVMYLFNGTLPKRAQGDLAYWAGVIPGDTSSTLWTTTHPYADLPKVIDPPSGWVQNTNDPPWSSTYPQVLDPAKFPSYTAPRDYSFRTSSSIRLLTSAPKLSFADVVRSKFSTRLEFADRVVDDLVAAAKSQGSERARSAATVLGNWDRQTESGSRGALLFEAWAKRFAGPTYANKRAFAVPQDFREPLTTPRGLADPAAALKSLEEAATETEKAYGALDAPWGDFRRLIRGKTDLPGNGAPGGLGAFRVLQFAGAPKPAAIMGDTFVCLVEFSNPIRAQVSTSYGNSSQPGSPHSEDQLPLVSAKKLRDVWRTKKEVLANLESRDRL